jgi:large subunit ribosomal protein L10
MAKKIIQKNEKVKIDKSKKAHVSPIKVETVKSLKDLIKHNKTFLIASIKNLPANKFQEIGKKLRGKAVVKFPKRNLIIRAIDESGNSELSKIKEHIEDSTAILFSNIDAYELAGELLKNKSHAKAKPGQEAPEDIEVQEGPTDLVPGPAVSELGALGIEIKIEKGKIAIARSKVIVRKGSKITQEQADVMSKLDIKPFSIGFMPLSAFDIEAGKMYNEIKIDPEGTTEEIKKCYSKALPFAVQIGYAVENTIKFILMKAGMHEKALLKLSHTPQEVNSNGGEN